MPEVHVIGEVYGASGFDEAALFCKWKFEIGPQWRKISGSDSGTTHVVKPREDDYIWSHPLDVHYATKAIEGWPRILFQVWKQDSFGRNDFCGYAVFHLPCAPGVFELETPCWRPQGTLLDEMTSFFLGGRPQLRDEDLILSGEDRYRLRTLGAGSVKLRISVILKDFQKHGIAFK